MVSLTDEGLRVLQEAQQTHHRGLEQRLFSRLSHDEVVELGELTSRILAGEHADGWPSSSYEGRRETHDGPAEPPVARP